MKKLIKEFIDKLNKDGVFSEDQITEFESFGATIQTMLEEAEEKGKESGKKDAEEEAEKDMDEVEETFKGILTKIGDLHEAETKLAVIKFKEHAELTVKEEEIVTNISKYLKEAVEEHMPAQAIVDYAELDRLRKTFESIKEAVVITDTEVQAKITSVIESTQGEIEQKDEALNTAIQRNIDYKSELDLLKSEKALESKLQDIPEFEQIKLRKHFNESTAEEIDKEFDTVLEQIKQKEYDVEAVVESKSNGVIKEDVEEVIVESDMDRYSKLADRWIPNN